MLLFVTFFVLPTLGVIWFLNLMTFMEKLHNSKNTHNQKILGGFWTFVFIFVFLYCFISLIESH